MKTTKQLIFIIATVAMISVSVMAQASKLQDLVNARAGQAEADLENRGYVVTHTERSDDAIFSYWWNQSSKKCVSVKTVDGRYAVITDAMNFDCNQKDSAGMSSGAKAGIAAGVTAAAIGAIVIAHKAHHHDDDKHYESQAQENEYERGYRDGLYNNAYHNYNNAKEYSSGYGAGVAQRNNNLSHSTRTGGYQPYISLTDLQGVRASSGESEMDRRGFRNVDGFNAGNASYTIWFNRNTRQCVQVITSDGRYESLQNIDSHPKCR